MKRILTGAMALMIATTSLAQDTQTISSDSKKKPYYFTSGGNGAILSFASVKEGGERISTIPRFTFFFNVGSNFNYDVSDNLGFFTGLNIKNIGLITKVGNEKLKRRVYTLGMPIGFKVGCLNEGMFFFGGAELDMAFNYKEKYFVGGDKKSKFNEWFSDRTDRLMPSVFAGIQVTRNFNFKVQYYLNDFFNENYKDGNGQKIYQNSDAKIFFLTVGYNIHHSSRLSERVKYRHRSK